MQFVITAYDGKDMLEKRMQVRPRHLENLARVNGTVICAGGLLDEVGKMKGSMIVFDFQSREDLDLYLASEPYITENVWMDVKVEPMNVVLVNGERWSAD